MSESVPRGQPSLATSENQPVATSEKPPGTWLPTPVRSRGPRPRRRPRRGHNLNLGGKAQGWSWVGAPALGGGQSRCQCRGVSHSCGVRLEFPKKGCPLQGRQRNQLPARCAAVRPTGDVLVPAPGLSTKSSKWCWAIPGWCTLALLGMCTGKGPAGKVATGWRGDKRNHVVGFRFKSPGVAQDGRVWLQGHMPLRAVRGVEQGSLSTRNPPWERGGKVRARGGRRGHGGQAAWACGGIQNLKPKGHGRQKHKKNGRLRVAGPRQQQGAAGCPAKGWPRMPTSGCTRCRPGWVGWASR